MSSNVFLYSKPDVNHKTFQQIINQASGLDLSTGKPNPVGNLQTLWKHGNLRHFSFGFIVCLHVDQIDDYIEKYHVSAHYTRTLRDGVVLLITETLERWVMLCNKDPTDAFLKQVKNLILQTDFAGAFL